MKRYDAIKRIVESLNDELIVCNLGAPSRELYNIMDRDENFYMLGSMGLSSSIAFGIAISKPKRKVICIDGDGSILMNLGSLCTIANNNPQNLILIVIDNSSYGSTGDQKTYTSNKTRLEIIAKGAGFNSITVIDKEDQIQSILKNLKVGCHFVLIKTQPGNADVENVPLLPEEVKERFRKVIS
ncbi:MAG: sulfopyruvate decarboxylase subunit beta [Promethearchaeota archaeon]|jgi:sulfopyruvate decarboxylase subunit beta